MTNGRMIERRTTEKIAMWERLVLAVVAPLLTITLVRGCSAIDDLNALVGTLAERQAVMESKVGDVRGALSDVYRRRAARRAHAEIFRTDKDQYNRLDDHEKRLRNLESR